MKKLLMICLVFVGCKETPDSNSPQENQVIEQGKLDRNIIKITGRIFQPINHAQGITYATSLQIDLSQFTYSATLSDAIGSVQCQIQNHPVQAAEYVSLKAKIDSVQICQNTRPNVCPMIAAPYQTFSLYDSNNAIVLVENIGSRGCVTEPFSCDAKVADELSVLLANKIVADIAACH